MHAGWRKQKRSVRLAFACFVLIHLACEAYRAFTDAAVPEAGLEAEPWLVGTLLLGVWLPFLALAASELVDARRSPRALTPQQRALALLEPTALCLVLVFTGPHVAHYGWPLLTGAALGVDVRPMLVASLSTTRSGLPLHAIASLAAVGAASFYAVRQAQRALPRAARVLLALGVLAYLLGSYAVIRVASGTLLP